jgi:hypothetical protein
MHEKKKAHFSENINEENQLENYMIKAIRGTEHVN